MWRGLPGARLALHEHHGGVRRRRQQPAHHVPRHYGLTKYSLGISYNSNAELLSILPTMPGNIATNAQIHAEKRRETSE